MRTCQVVRTLVQAAFLGTLASGFAVAQTPQTGTITGRVTDAATGQPVSAAQVGIVGTNAGTQATSEGVYTLRGVNAGTVQIRVLRVGYAEVKQTVTVAGGQTVTANVQMRGVVATLAPVVTTATGEQRRVEVGNAIAQVDAAKLVETSPVSNMGDLLTARAPGVMVIGGTQTGAGTRVRVRGTSSLSLTNNPIYVIDGVRVEGTTGSSTLDVGGSTPSRVGDLNPEEIENIEIVRGPSASTLYGTDAANGVIVITTKRGIAGKTQWTYYTEQSAIQDRNNYPDRLLGLAHRHNLRHDVQSVEHRPVLPEPGLRWRLQAGQCDDVQPHGRQGVDAVWHWLPAAAWSAASRRHRFHSVLRPRRVRGRGRRLESA